MQPTPHKCVIARMHIRKTQKGIAMLITSKASRKHLEGNFSQKYGQNIWRYQKKPYLCSAFERQSNKRSLEGRLAQLVQSICLTSRGSGVRIPQRPPSNTSLLSRTQIRAFSSAGSEHLPYKQRVGGSNPSTPTNSKRCIRRYISFFIP